MNTAFTKILISVLASSVLVISACGQKGPLVRPNDSTVTDAPATSVEGLEKQTK